MKVAVLCKKGYPSTKMRAEPLCQLGYDILYKPPTRSYDTIIVVKRPPVADWSVVRKRCQRLIYDPLDYWATGKHKSVEEFNFEARWAALKRMIDFDELLVTSPAAAETAKTLSTPVHVVLHHGDPSIELSWYDPNGHIVYAGLAQFVSPIKQVLADAAKSIGRSIRFAHGPMNAQRELRGASLVLALRAGRFYHCPVCRYIKSLVKLENAAAMGAPVIYNGTPAEASVHPGHVQLNEYHYDSPRVLRERLIIALQSPPALNPFRLEDYLMRMKEIVGE